MADLRTTIDAGPIGVVLSGPPVDLGRALGLWRPVVRVRHHVEEVGPARFDEILVGR